MISQRLKIHKITLLSRNSLVLKNLEKNQLCESKLAVKILLIMILAE
jgi:hypothetical protein